MSADNWRPCPACAAAAEAKARAAREAADAGYGVVPLDEFDALRAKAQRLTDVAREMAEGQSEESDTFREDYSIGTRVDGRFWVTYRGNCTECAYSVSYEHEQAFPTSLKGRRRG